MNFQEIQLETNDDLASIYDKLDGLNSSRVILIRPNGTTGFAKRLDMVLLLRHVQAAGIRVALVAKEPPVRAEARMAGLSSYSSVKAARRAKWRTIPPRHPPAISPRYSTIELNALHDGLPTINQIAMQPILVRVFLFTLGIAAVLGLAVYILMTTQPVL